MLRARLSRYVVLRSFYCTVKFRRICHGVTFSCFLHPVQGFGGTASGFEVLQRLHLDINAILRPLGGKPLSETAIVDLMNCIGRCVVAGDVRQTAEIAFGDPNSTEYLDLKVKFSHREDIIHFW